METKQNITKRLSEQKWFFLALVLTLLAAWGLITYLGMAQTPIKSIELTPARQPGAWTYALADGTPVTSEEDGRLVLPDEAATLYCTTALDGYGMLTSSALLAVSSRACDVAVFSDGELLADPSHRFDEISGAFSEPTGRAAGSGLFTLGAAKTLTLAVQFQSPEASVNLLPSVTVYPELAAYQSIHLTEGARAALPAGIFLAITAVLMLLFMFRLYGGKGNVDVLLLALVALSFCLLNTLPYGIYVVWFLQTPFVSYTLRLLPTLMLLWILWCRWNGKLRRFGWLLPLLCTVAVAAGIVWRKIDIVSGNAFTNLLQGKLLPLSMLSALLLCVWQAICGNDTYRRFFRMGGVLAALLGLATAISFLRNGGWSITLQTAFRNTALLGYFELLQMVNQFLLILLFLLAFYDFVMSIVRRNAELQTLTLQNRYAAEHAEHLRRSLDDTREMRHEMRHHVQALQALCADGEYERVKDYVDTLGSSFFSEPVRYSDHTLVNALVTACSQRAEKLGAEFDASVHVPETIDIRDTDLAVILSNMIDNAMEALSVVPNKKDRKLHLKIAVYEDTGLFISCTNTFVGELKQDQAGEYLSTKEADGHGLGMKAMKRVAEAYNSLLVPEVNGNTFHIKTYLNYKK